MCHVPMTSHMVTLVFLWHSQFLLTPSALRASLLSPPAITTGTAKLLDPRLVLHIAHTFEFNKFFLKLLLHNSRGSLAHGYWRAYRFNVAVSLVSCHWFQRQAFVSKHWFKFFLEYSLQYNTVQCASVHGAVRTFCGSWIELKVPFEEPLLMTEH